MRSFVAITLAASIASLVATDVFAGDAPLPSGKPAGLSTAQDRGANTVLIGVGVGAIIAGAVLLANNNGNSTLITGTTTTR